MKSNYRIILPIVLLAGVLLSFTIKQNPDPEKDRILLGLIKYALTQGHYEPQDLNDEFSKAVFDDFIDDLDPTRRFFTNEDIQEFSIYQDKIDDQIKNEDLTFYNVVYTKYNLRMQEAKGFYKEILKYPFDFNKDETFDVDYDKKAFPKNEIELIINWQKHLKLITITRLYDKLETENDRKKENADYKVKSLKELEIEARKATLNGMEETFDRFDDLDETDWFSVFINSISEEFDPHTTYFAPKIKKKFDIDMAGKLEGIGARLQKDGDYTKVSELISGGPAWRAGELEVGDFIIKVAQADGEPLDIVGMRLDDAIEFIKGKKGTEVRLTLKKIDGAIKTISIIRDVVVIDETFAKSSVVKKRQKKIRSYKFT